MIGYEKANDINVIKLIYQKSNKTINYQKQTDNQTNSNNQDKSTRPLLSRDLGIPVSVIVFVAWQPSRVFQTSNNVTISYHDRRD